MKKLTKKFIKKVMCQTAFKSERIVDIEIFDDGMTAKIITIYGTLHIPQIYIMKFDGKQVRTFFEVLDYDVKKMFEKPVAVTNI